MEGGVRCLAYGLTCCASSHFLAFFTRAQAQAAAAAEAEKARAERERLEVVARARAAAQKARGTYIRVPRLVVSGFHLAELCRGSFDIVYNGL